MKPLGIVVCILGTLVIAALSLGVLSMKIAPPMAAATLMIIFIQLCFWMFIIRPNWVAMPAEAYAKILLEYCDKAPI